MNANLQMAAGEQLEEILRPQINATLAESYGMGINANINYSMKVLNDMKNSGQFTISYKQPAYRC